MQNFWAGPVGDFVQEVDPADLRKTWAAMNYVQKLHPGQPGEFSIGHHPPDEDPEVREKARQVEQACWFRASMLMLLCQGPLADRLTDGEPDDRLVEIVARFPMKKMEPGVPQKGLPFDVNEFRKQLEQSA
jgi:hypothetical protein